ncbi:MAG TPA: hypothetical protein VFE46_05120 [Pirellulales bacterium]|nr:hypothetical protein [Pirellulales bacterium]
MITAVLFPLALFILGSSIRKTRGTTLTSPLIWVLLSLVALGTSVLACAQLTVTHDRQVADDFWLVAYTSTFCPLISLLGAKRPQHKVWQLIVFSFWVIAALPALQAMVLHPGDNLEVPTIWKCFYVGLWLLGIANYVPTRYALVSLFVGVGQLWLLWRFLELPANNRVSDPILCVGLLGAAVCTSALPVHFSSFWSHGSRENVLPFVGWTRVWRDFRDAYGSLWGARVMDRVNSLLESADVHMQLQWDGFRSATPVLEKTPNAAALALASNPTNMTTPQTEEDLRNNLEAMEQVARNVLRRFVSNDWIDRRLNTA